MLCYLNGQFLPRATATVPAEDRGFVFGDGVYEVWRVIDGRLFECDRHLKRLNSGLRELRIATPEIATLDELLRVASRVLGESGLLEGEATLYLEITRGAAPRAHAFPPASVAPTVFMMANRFVPSPEQRAKGVSVVTTPDIRWLRCDIKTIQLLPNVMAKQVASEKGAAEAVFIRDGVMTEGSHANVFAVIDGVVRTHPLTNLILPGVTRAVVVDVAKSIGMPLREEACSADEFFTADEVFLAGTTNDVMPVVRIDDRVVGDGKPGPMTMKLYEAFRAYMDRALASAPSVVTTARG